MSTIVPSDITTKGKVDKNVWLAGVLVRSRERTPQSTTSTGKAATGKSAGKKGKGPAKAAGPRSCLEVHICGGTTPADVMMLEAWAAEPKALLQAFLNQGEPRAFKCTKFLVKPHTEKTRPWTTSRLQFFGELLSDSLIEAVELNPSWLTFHPPTPIDDLQHVPEGMLVCVPGRVLPPGATKKDVEVGHESVPITNFNILNRNELISMSAWRDLAGMPTTLTTGDIYMFEAIKKVTKKGSDKTNVELRYLNITKQTPCPEELQKEIDSSTAATSEGANAWSRAPEGRTGSQRDYSNETPHWFSLSVCVALLSSKHRRKLSDLATIPSVFVTNLGHSLTYLACSGCRKGLVNGVQTCSCQSQSTTVRWRATLQLTDGTAQLTATVFDSMAALVAHVAEDDPEKAAEYYHEQPGRVEDLMLAMAAMPYTLMLSFEDSDFSDSIEAHVQLAEPTFESGKDAFHPLKPYLRSLTDAARCPPCMLADTTFNQGAGVTLVPGGSVMCFRALLEVFDKPQSMQRETDTSPALRVTRKVQCALRAQSDAEPLALVQNGPIELVSRLVGPKKKGRHPCHRIVAPGVEPHPRRLLACRLERCAAIQRIFPKGSTTAQQHVQGC